MIAFCQYYYYCLFFPVSIWFFFPYYLVFTICNLAIFYLDSMHLPDAYITVPGWIKVVVRFIHALLVEGLYFLLVLEIIQTLILNFS